MGSHSTVSSTWSGLFARVEEVRELHELQLRDVAALGQGCGGHRTGLQALAATGLTHHLDLDICPGGRRITLDLPGGALLDDALGLLQQGGTRGCPWEPGCRC